MQGVTFASWADSRFVAAVLAGVGETCFVAFPVAIACQITTAQPSPRAHVATPGPSEPASRGNVACVAADACGQATPPGF